MEYSADERALIWLNGCSRFSRKQKLELIREAKKPAVLLENIGAVRDFIVSCYGEGEFVKLCAAVKSGECERTIAQLNEKGITVVTCMSDYYPQDLLDTDEPPVLLYCMGNIELLKKRKFSIIGSRHSLPFALKKAEEFAEKLSEQGVSVVCGTAEGVETVVMRGALKRGNLITVLAHGFDYFYPESNRQLLIRAESEGLAVSEYAPDVRPQQYLFRERNRIIAGLCEGVLVCSASKRSGCRITADFATDYGRDLFAFPYGIGVSSGEGCNALIKSHANLCDSIDDIFFFLGMTVKEEEKPTLGKSESEVYEIIKEDGQTHFDVLLQKTGKPVYELMGVLSMLEIKKMIVKNIGNTYSAL